MAKAVLPRGFARQHVLDAALCLFAEHGVNGTSLQMIAGRLGVSKAAVYYQFHSKDEIVLEVIRPMFDDIERLVTTAAAVPNLGARREVAVSGLVEMCVRHRRITSVLYRDPVVDAAIESDADLQRVLESFGDLISGPEPDAMSRTLRSMVISGIYGATHDPHLHDLEDAELRVALLDCAQRLVRTYAISA